MAALAGVRGAITYEGQAAIELEMVSGAHGLPYPFAIEGGDDQAPAQVRLAPLFAALLDDLEAGREPGFVGSRLHATLAAIVRDACLLRARRDAACRRWRSRAACSRTGFSASSASTRSRRPASRC